MYYKFKGGKIYYYDSGKGTCIVLLHGYLESSEVWNNFAKKLASCFRVISVDLPGHGLSYIYGDTHSMEFMAEAIKELLDSLNIKKAVLAGHSLGGYVTLAFLDLYPEYLSGFCLFHSHPFADPPEVVEKRLREIDIVKAGKKDLIYPENVTRMFSPSNLEKFSGSLQQLKNIASRIPGDGIIAILNGMIIRPSRLILMEEGSVPCLWILGSMDSYIPCDLIQSKVSLPSNASVVVLRNSGHIGFIEEEDLSLKLISDFAEKLQY